MNFKACGVLALIILSGACSNDADTLDTAKYIYVPDAQFEMRLINLGIDGDGETNQKVLKSDAVNVEYLDLSSETTSEEISDLTGIEGFPNLKRLYAIGNKLSSVDLSNNALLDTLNLAGNNLSTIDLSNNSRLVMLDLKVNDLTSISGLSNAINLRWLNLSFNLFEKYTVENPSLENILMSHNQLVSFDSSVAANLQSLYILTNGITYLDLTQNTLLETVNMGDNKLTHVEFGLKEHLAYLSCFGNLLNSLDVSNFDMLDYLSANRNPDLDCIQIKNGQEIPTLKLSDYQSTNVNCN
ncbi:MAG: leucine-rich repeat domain-containing protein [Allomuricauda sp.]